MRIKSILAAMAAASMAAAPVVAQPRPAAEVAPQSETVDGEQLRGGFIIPLAIIVRMTRASVLEVLNEDYVRTAHAKGLAPSLITRRHVLRNAMLPVSTTIGLSTGALLAGAVLTESVFAFNGIGSYLFDAISGLDFAVLQGFILFIAVIYALINLVVDLLYGVIDPRLRAA